MNSPAPAIEPRAKRKRGGAFHDFWQRLSEGRQIDELWSQFAADAKAGYGFYGRDVDWEEIKRISPIRRPFHIVRGFFWTLLLKLSPARRVLLFIALVLLVFSGSDLKLEVTAALIFLVLLLLELADKVIMKRDLEIAREIQSWLVPSVPPEVSGAEIAFATRPQNSVAGDYYDAFYPNEGPADGGKLMLVIADVAGKSVPAALLMATLQASLRTIAGDDAPLAELVARLNRYSCAHSLGGLRFTTGVFAQYDPASRILTYVNAGHNTPILRRAGGQIERLETGGLPLGIQNPTVYETATVVLEPGDLLIFFTDGVVEAFNKDGEEFSDARWVRVIRTLPSGSAQALLQSLMTGVDDFVGATRQSDDITCMVFRGK